MSDQKNLTVYTPTDSKCGTANANNKKKLKRFRKDQFADCWPRIKYLFTSAYYIQMFNPMRWKGDTYDTYDEL